jgi:hypothetical protein
MGANNGTHNGTTEVQDKDKVEEYLKQDRDPAIKVRRNRNLFL